MDLEAVEVITELLLVRLGKYRPLLYCYSSSCVPGVVCLFVVGVCLTVRYKGCTSTGRGLYILLNGYVLVHTTLLNCSNSWETAKQRCACDPTQHLRIWILSFSDEDILDRRLCSEDLLYATQRCIFINRQETESIVESNGRRRDSIFSLLYEISKKLFNFNWR